MRVLSLIIILLCSFSIFGQDSDTFCILRLEGDYRNQNLYVINPYTDKDSGFCIQKIRVNGNLVPFEQASAFELRLSDLSLDSGQHIILEFKHSIECVPKILYQEVPSTHGLFIQNLKISKHGLLSWSINEFPHLSTFEIELYRWNTWQKVATLHPGDTISALKYQSLITFHSGENKVRVVLRRLQSPNSIVTDYVTFHNPTPPVTITRIDRKKRVMYISTASDWQLYDQQGNILKTDRSDIIEWPESTKLPLYLNYDNKSAKISKR